MASISRREAREVVEQIRRRNGGIRESDRLNTPEDVLEIVENLKDQLGIAVKTVATNLYSTDTRFVFELIQNAEDNSYANAIAGGEEPYISFALHSDRIIVDSNEDGFLADHVRAICSIGQSTKHNMQGYIGEKGIGFKSVFKVSEKVYIQSGPFSFYFQHRIGENGLGMVTPMSHPHEELPQGVRTRMTLILLPSKFETCEKELKEIQDTLILFLSKLKSIKVAVHHQDNPPSTTTYSCTSAKSTPTVTLTKTVDSTSTRFFYRVTRKNVVNLPAHPARKGKDKAEVILAFPTTELFTTPITNPQHVFAFLPVRMFGFNFIIQSDFVTDASRQDIDHSQWNEAILRGVAETFVEAVKAFCRHPILRYDWLKYLPGDTIYDPFWKQLRVLVLELLKDSPVLRSWGGKLCKPQKLRHLTPEYLDKNDHPLFDDLEDECYLSSNYSWDSDRHALLALGVKRIGYPELIPRIEPYLKRRLFGRRFLDLPFHDDWHTRVSGLLRKALDTKYASGIKSLSLVPLPHEELASVYDRDIYFPYDKNSIQVPTDLGLTLVETRALTNPSLKVLYDKLGVRYCDPDEIVPKIIRRYNRKDAVNLLESVSHLRYMFHSLPKDGELDNTIFVMDENETRVYRKFVPFGVELAVDDVYFDTRENYGIRHLQTAINQAGKVLELDHHFIHGRYLAAGDSEERRHGRSWSDWLQEKAAVRYIPRLRDESTNRLAIIWYHISISCPWLLLGALRTYWPQYPGSEKTLQIRSTLKSLTLSCENIAPRRLNETYLPLEDLKKIARELFIDDRFPFLLLPNEWPNDNILAEWHFLTEFGVGTRINLLFYLRAFYYLVGKSGDSISSEARVAIFKIYEEIVSHATEDDYDTIRIWFNKIKTGVYIEKTKDYDGGWTSAQRCVWGGPSFLSVKYPLASYKIYSQSLKIKTLCCDILRIKNATWRVYLGELHEIKSKNEPNFENLCAIYRYLQKINVEEKKTEIRNEFRRDMLVYVQHAKKWCSPDLCLWTSSPNIGKQYGIESIYPDFQKLFVEHLGTKAPTVATYVEQLTTLILGTAPNVQDVKDAIHSINQLLPTETSSSRELDIMKKLKCFPVKLAHGRGQIQYQSYQDGFIVLDHVDFGNAFQDKLSFLDFSLREVHTLKPLFVWLGLEDRYLSRLVTVSTDVQQPSMEPDQRLTRDFRRKAKPLYRCSYHYRSPKTNNGDQGILHLFEEASLYASDGFTRALRVTQNDHIVSVDSDVGTIHLDDSDETLKIYVPRDKAKRALCYSTHLGMKLTEYVQINNAKATMFCLVLTSRNSVVDAMLDSHGIIPLEEFGNPEGTQSVADSSSDSEEEDDMISVSATSQHSSRLPSSRPIMVHDTLEDDSSLNFSERFSTPVRNARQNGERRYGTPSTNSRSRTPVATPSTPLRSPDPIPPSNGDATASDYIRLLQRVIDATRTARFPVTGPFDMHELAAALPGDNVDGIGRDVSGLPFGSRTQNRIAHDIRIGAAGELFVFELLLRLGLQGFGRANWQSTIRKEVRVHPDYHDLEPWNGVETADITYKDTEGSLTALLIDKGYLRTSEAWRSTRPKYYIEVKTTTVGCNSPFYISRGQFKRMQDMRLSSGGGVPSNQVYLIFRVYNLNNGQDIGLRIYMDPGTLHANGQLTFTPETYRVIPAAGASSAN